MEKSTLYLIAVIVVCVTIVGVSGEYFTYKYYSLKASQQNQQVSTNLTPNTSSSQQGSSANSIASFVFQNPMAVGSIDESGHTVTLTVPPATDVTNLTPTIQISENATISPQSGVKQNFTNPVVYTVTAQNGSVQKYNVTVNIAKSAEELITSFKLAGFSPEIDGYIDNDNHTVTVVVPDGTDLTNLAPTIEVSENAAVLPASGSAQNFTSPIIYTVTNAYGGKQNYTVLITTESNSG